jgi:eukaryotic-like serine/threonine-protein kinase
MSTDPRIEIDRLLMQALDLDGAERNAFVDGIQDPALRAEVADMLALCDSASDPLALDAVAAARLIDAAIDGEAPALAAALGFEDAPLPERIGGWRIIERIGAGGMGEVRKGERIEAGFEQLGAMKLIRSGYAIGEFARRFLQERQILARLNHPGIAGLLDGGRDGQGHPYLVMEYVDGAPIDHYCDTRSLGIDARIDLFIEVCRAVAHAHRSLVIHRDLKPSNILVREDGRVKLLDFGIAKVLGDTENGDPLATRIEQRLFTPDYASPEQVRGQAVTTTSDVYQLGLLLYELLCGHRAQKLGHNSGPAAAERIVCEQEPTRPSQRIGSGDAELAARRHLQPAQLKRRLRGDLDLIVGKALQKAPERRYGTVDELIDDLQRSRKGHTLHARPDTLSYRAQRFARRHPVGLVFASVTLVLLGFYLVTLNLQAQALERERDRAQAEASKARQVQGLMQRLFEGIDPDVSGGEPLSVQELLDRSFAQIEGELDAHPEVQAELLLTVGDVYAALGNYARAEELLTQAMTLAEPLEAEQPVLAARVYRSRGRLLAQGNELDLPESLMRRALAQFRETRPSDSQQVATTLFHLAELLRRRGRAKEALAASQEALRLRRDSASDTLEVASSLNQVTMIERSLGTAKRAAERLRESLELMTARLPESHPRIAETKADLAMVLHRRGQLEQAVPLYESAAEGLIKSRGEKHPSLGIVLGNLGGLLAELKRYEDAEKLNRQALQIHRENFGDHHARVALALNALGRSLSSQGRRAEAVQAYREALLALPTSHSTWAPTFHRNLGIAQLRAGNPREALQAFAEVEARLSEQDTEVLERARLHSWQAAAWLAMSDFEQARGAAEAALRIFEAPRNDQPSEREELEYPEALRSMAMSLIALGRPEEAVAPLTRAQAWHLRQEDPDAAALHEIESTLNRLENMPARP